MRLYDARRTILRQLCAATQPRWLHSNTFRRVEDMVHHSNTFRRVEDMKSLPDVGGFGPLIDGARPEDRKRLRPENDFRIIRDEFTEGHSRSYYLRPPPEELPVQHSASPSDAKVQKAPEDRAAYAEANEVFDGLAPVKLYEATHFRELARNDGIPEICLLGPSNAGKSHLINSLLGILTGKARPDKMTTRAHVGKNQGTTRGMGVFAVGDPQRVRVSNRSPFDIVPLDRRRHVMHIIDVPGYGWASDEVWGIEIVKLIQNRTALKGAILVVPHRPSSQTKLLEGELAVMRLLGRAGLPAVIVVSKVDLLFSRTKEVGKEQERMAVMAKQIHAELAAFQEKELEHALDEDNASWEYRGRGREKEPILEGRAPPGPIWVPEIVFTSARGVVKKRTPKKLWGMTGARVAILKLAGVFKRDWLGPEDPKSSEATSQPSAEASSSIVPFDQIVWKDTSTPVEIDQSAEKEMIQQPGWPGAKAAQKEEAITELTEKEILEAQRKSKEDKKMRMKQNKRVKMALGRLDKKGIASVAAALTAMEEMKTEPTESTNSFRLSPDDNLDDWSVHLRTTDLQGLISHKRRKEPFLATQNDRKQLGGRAIRAIRHVIGRADLQEGVHRVIRAVQCGVDPRKAFENELLAVTDKAELEKDGGNDEGSDTESWEEPRKEVMSEKQATQKLAEFAHDVRETKGDGPGGYWGKLHSLKAKQGKAMREGKEKQDLVYSKDGSDLRDLALESTPKPWKRHVPTESTRKPWKRHVPNRDELQQWRRRKKDAKRLGKTRDKIDMAEFDRALGDEFPWLKAI